MERRKLADEPILQKHLRLWPGLVAVAVQWLTWFVVPIVMPGAIGGYIAAFGGLLGGVPIVVWWAFFSGAPRSERWGAVVLMVVALVATRPLLHESMATAGLGMVSFIYAIPVLSLALVVWAVVSRRLSDGRRRAALVATILLACGVWTLVRTDGVTGDAESEFAWRWAETPEERLLAHGGDEPMASRRLPQQRTQEPTGLAFADPIATASPAARGSRPTGLGRRRSSCGAGRSAPAGRPSRSAATSSIPRSSAVTTRSSPATT